LQAVQNEGFNLLVQGAEGRGGQSSAHNAARFRRLVSVF
jgi:hypothetical protein